MALLGSTPTLRCSSCGSPLVGKVAHLCRVKIYSNSRAHGTGRVTVWSHNKCFFWEWTGWRELFWEKCLAGVPCATADEESSSNLKLGSCVDQHYVLLGTIKLALKIISFK